VKNIRRGQFVVGSFFASDNTCEICHAGYQSRCVHVEYVGAGGAQAPCCASRSPTARWLRHRRFRPMT
jgi:threonine dehydrogenase-like Zn-dependent dehydrogenase